MAGRRLEAMSSGLFWSDEATGPPGGAPACDVNPARWADDIVGGNEVTLADDRTRLGTLNQPWLAGRELIVASHRGPVEHQLGPDGSLVPHRGSGGLMTALT